MKIYWYVLAQSAPELILEHSNFKTFPQGSMPPDPCRLDGFHNISPPSHVSPPIPKHLLMPLNPLAHMCMRVTVVVLCVCVCVSMCLLPCYSGAFIIRTPLGTYQTVLIIEVSLVQRLCKLYPSISGAHLHHWNYSDNKRRPKGGLIENDTSIFGILV